MLNKLIAWWRKIPSVRIRHMRLYVVRLKSVCHNPPQAVGRITRKDTWKRLGKIM